MISRKISSLVFALATFGAATAFAQAAPDALIKGVSEDVITSVKADKQMQAGDLSRIQALVDSKVLPHVDLSRMTAAVVGKSWRQASAEQKDKLQAQFKTLLVRTYAGALTRVKEQTTVSLKPLRAAAEETEVTVRTEIKGNGDPVEIDYRLEKQPEAWQVFDVNVEGVWLVDQYRSSFAQVIAQSGIDGLIAQLEAKNKAPAAAKS